MQPMARPGIKHYPEARSLSAQPGFRLLIAMDIVVHLAALIWAAFFVGDAAVWFSFATVLLSIGVMLADQACFGLRPLGMIWRRRLGVGLVLLLLLRGGPVPRWVAVVGTLWTGAVWIGTLLEGKRVAQAVVEATGEEGLGEDPSRYL